MKGPACTKCGSKPIKLQATIIRLQRYELIVIFCMVCGSTVALLPRMSVRT